MLIMAWKCEVASLRSLALHNVVTQVIHTLSDDCEENCELVSQYYEYVPAEILEDVLSTILDNQDLDASIRFCCLKVLLKSRIKRLSTGVFPNSYYERILKIIATNGTGLTNLNLEGVWAARYPELLCDIIRNLVRLEILHIPHMAGDSVLECIAKAPCLRLVNISSECPFTTAGLAKFSQMLAARKTNLSVIDIGNFGAQQIPHESIAELIEMNPQLLTLHSYSYVGKAVYRILQRNPTFTCELRYIHDKRTTKHICDAIFQTCPRIDKLYVERPEEGVIDSMSKFSSLNTLKLYKFQCSEFQALLSSSWGSTLNSLDLTLGKGDLDMSAIAQACTNLTSLRLIKMEYLMHTSEHIFPQLYDVEIRYCNLTAPCLRYILGRSPELCIIDVRDPVHLTDRDLRQLTADYSLLCLEQLCFTDARHLTVVAVELLMGHCPQLRELGLIGCWNLSNDDVDYVRAIVQSTNSSINLLVNWIN